MAVVKPGLLLLGFLLMSASGGLGYLAWHDGAIGVATSAAEIPVPGDAVRLKGDVAPADRAESLARLVVWQAPEGSALPEALAAGGLALLVAESEGAPLLAFFPATEPAPGAAVLTGDIVLSERLELTGGNRLDVVVLERATVAEPILF